MDDLPNTICEDCDACFVVIFNNWYGRKPIEYCPFCGSENLIKEYEDGTEEGTAGSA